MILETIHNGLFNSNCYIVGDNGHGILIDAGVPVEHILRRTDKLGITIDYIVLTHGHVDHICHSFDLKERFKCPLMIHEADSEALRDPLLNGSILFGIDMKAPSADILLKHGDTITLHSSTVNPHSGTTTPHSGTITPHSGTTTPHSSTITLQPMRFMIIHTPGHTSGGICIRADNVLFTGDTLFKLSIGRTDLGFGSHNQLQESIKTRLMTLEDRVVVYPGHGPSTSIGYERKNNPYIA